MALMIYTAHMGIGISGGGLLLDFTWDDTTTSYGCQHGVSGEE